MIEHTERKTTNRDRGKSRSGLGLGRPAVLVAGMAACMSATCLWTARPALAQGSGVAADRAEQLFQRARDAVVHNRFQEAYEPVREAWSIRKSYDIAGLLGQTELELHKFRDAAEHLAFCVRVFPPKEGEAKRKRGEGLLAEAKKHVAEVEIGVSQAGAEVLVDGVSVGRSPLEAPVFMEPGKHSVDGKLQGYVAGVATVDGGAGAKQQVTLMLKPVAPVAATTVVPTAVPSSSAMATAAPTASSAPTADAGTTSGGLSTKTIVVATGGVLTVAAAVIGIVYWRKAASADSDAASLQAQAAGVYGPSPCVTQVGAGSSYCVESNSKLDDRNSAHKIETGAFIGAGVLAAGTVATWFLWPHATEQQPGVSLVPYLNSASGGLLVNGRF